MSYDLIIVGGGPAGTMAAATAGEIGLKAALIERKTHPAKIYRICSTMFAIESDWYIGDRMYFNQDAKKFVFPENALTIDYDGPYAPFYTWWHLAPDGETTMSLGDYEKQKALGPVKGRLSVAYSKGHLINSLVEKTKRNGVEIHTCQNVISARKEGELVVVKTAEGKTFRAPFVIAADGVNSRLAKNLGLNKERQFYGTLISIGLFMRGCTLPTDRFIWATHFGSQYNNTMAGIWLPFVFNEEHDPKGHQFILGGLLDKRVDYMAELEYFMRKSPFAKFFEKKVEIRYRLACVENIWSPTKVPFRDNVLFAGDTVWTQEAEVTGSMLAGNKAAHAVATALRDKKLDREGVQSYLSWWKKSYPDAMDFRDYAEVFASYNILKKEDFNYLIKKIDKPLPHSLNPFMLNQHMGKALAEKMDVIKTENPAFLQRMMQVRSQPLGVSCLPSARQGYPNR